ncbi:hypothetical protein ACO1O0_005721 [Amphichorda felina]
MRFSSTVVSALLISFTGGALASSMGISARDAARRAVLEQRESGCKCKCVDECKRGCTAFGGTAGSQVAQVDWLVAHNVLGLNVDIAARQEEPNGLQLAFFRGPRKWGPTVDIQLVRLDVVLLKEQFDHLGVTSHDSQVKRCI